MVNLELFRLLVFEIWFLSFIIVIFVRYISHIYMFGKNRENFYYNNVNFFLVLLAVIFFIKKISVYNWFLYDYYLCSNSLIHIYICIYIFFFMIFFYVLLRLNIDLFCYFEYLIILMVLGFLMFILFRSCDLFFLFMLSETFSLCLYIIISVNYSSIKIAEAGLKYFIIASISALFFLYGIFLIYSIFGTLNFLKLKVLINYLYFDQDQSSLIIGIVLIFISFFFKLGLAPFHFWVVEVYYGVSLVTFFYLSIFSKYIFFIVFIKLLFIFSCYIQIFLKLFFFISFLSILIGTIGVFIHINIRCILAYNSISHNGFLLLSLCWLSYYSFFCFIYYILTYIILMLSFFLIYIILYINNYKFVHIYDFIYIRAVSFFLSLYILFLFLSMAGIPVFIGFIAKLFILINLFISELNLMIYGISILILNILGIFIYLRFIVFIYFSKKFYSLFKYKNVFDLWVLMVIMFIYNIFGWCLINYLYKYLYILFFFTYICYM